MCVLYNAIKVYLDHADGFFFYDQIMLMSDDENFHYIERDLTEHYHTLTKFPKSLYKKVTLLRYFRNYMHEHLMKTCGSMAPR